MTITATFTLTENANGRAVVSDTVFETTSFDFSAQRFANIKLFTVDQTLGGWAKVSKTHFADGGTFDQVMASIKR